MGLLQMESHDLWRDLSTQVELQVDDLSQTIHQDLQHQTLLDAARYLEMSKISERLHLCLIHALSNDRLFELAQLIERFQKGVAKIASKDEYPNEVYQVVVSVTPATTLRTNKKKEK